MMTRISAVAAAGFVVVVCITTQGTDAAASGAGGGEEEAEYLGCFHDNRADRVLGDKLTSSDMTTKVRRATIYNLASQDFLRSTDDQSG